MGKPQGARHEAYYNYMESLKQAEENAEAELVSGPDGRRQEVTPPILGASLTLRAGLSPTGKSRAFRHCEYLPWLCF